jgi:hypothetical protein
MDKKINFRILMLVVTIISLTGCGLSRIPASDVKDPSSPISSRETPVTQELGCFGDMLTTYRRIQTGAPTLTQSAKTIPIAVISVADKTGVYNNFGVSEIPKDMTDMAIGSIAKIGGALRLIHIPKDEEYVTSYYAEFGRSSGMDQSGNHVSLPSFFSKFAPRHYQNNVILVYGNLTEYDRTLKNHKTGLDGSIDYMSTDTRQGVLKQGTSEQQVYEDRADDSGGLSASYGNVENVSRMTMDFRVVKLNDGGMVSSESAVTNTILLYQRAEDKSFGVSLNGKSLGTLSTFGISGAVGYANTMTNVDARHAALRMLIERSAMEALGKTYNLPYWRCLAKEKAEEKNTNNVVDNSEKVFVVKPNDSIQLSDEAIRNVSNGIANQYPNSMMDKNVDLNVISAVKRYFEREDYLDKDTRSISFIQRPSEVSQSLDYLASNSPRVSEIQEFVAMEKKKFNTQKAEEKQKNEEWLSRLEERINSKNRSGQCGQRFFNEHIYHENYFPLIKGENEKFNPYFYPMVDTKECLFNQVASAYGKGFEQIKSEHKVYGKSKANDRNSDLFASLWINIPIELNARWKY